MIRKALFAAAAVTLMTAVIPGSALASGPALVSAGPVADAVSSVTPSFGQSTAAGDLEIAWAMSNDPASTFPISVSGSGWTLAVSAGNPYDWTGLYYKANSGSGDSAPVFSDTGYHVFAALSEYSGVATSSPLDETGGAYGQTTVSTGGIDAAGSDLIVGGITWNGSNPGAEFSFDIYGSDGLHAAGEDAITWNGNTQYDSGATSTSPFYGFVRGDGPATLGSHTDSLGNMFISQNENYPAVVIASFKAA